MDEASSQSCKDSTSTATKLSYHAVVDTLHRFGQLIILSQFCRSKDRDWMGVELSYDYVQIILSLFIVNNLCTSDRRLPRSVRF